MNENSLDDQNSSVINKSFHIKGINDKTFSTSILLLYDILKELEKEIENKNIFSANEKNKVHSLFSLLYFELSFIQQISKININNHVNKSQNDHIFNNTINYNKELLSKKIEQFLLFVSDKNKNIDLYKTYIQNTSINYENYNKNNNKKINSKIKSNSCLKKKIINNNNNINGNHVLKLNKKLNNEDLDNKKKKVQVLNNNKSDINNGKISSRYCYETTLKKNKINKPNIMPKKYKKAINKGINENRNKSKDNLKMINSNKDINIFKLDKINNNSINIEKRNSNLDIKYNKTINNFHKPSQSKENLSNTVLIIIV